MSERAKASAKSPHTKINDSISREYNAKYSESLDSSAKSMLLLQRTIGNQAVQRLIKSGEVQTKLRIGKPNDKYEQEADRIAEQVLSIPEAQVHRQLEEEEKEEEIVQTKPLSDQITPLVQRQIEPEEKEDEEEPIQASESTYQTPEISSDLQAQILSRKGGGQPLPETTCSYFESRFGCNLSQVKIHTGAEAAETARAINARAFAAGHDIIFGENEYSPKSSSGMLLLAHELTHVLQQKGRGIFSSKKTGHRSNDVVCNQETNRMVSTPRIVSPKRSIQETPPIMLLSRKACVKEERIPEKHTGVQGLQGLVHDYFEMNIDWDKTGSECDCSCGEYRQFVKGYVKVNGRPIKKKLYGGAYLEEKVYHEDVDEKGNPYGYRNKPENPNDKFINPDRATGCSYRGYDTPGIPAPSGAHLDMHLTFKGQTFDRCKKTFGKINTWISKWKGIVP